MWVTIFIPSGLKTTDCFNKNIVAESSCVKKYFYCLNRQVSKSVKVAWSEICSILFPYVAYPEGKKQNICKAFGESWGRKSAQKPLPPFSVLDEKFNHTS